jgi:hypothetical protein
MTRSLCARQRASRWATDKCRARRRRWTNPLHRDVRYSALKFCERSAEAPGVWLLVLIKSRYSGCCLGGRAGGHVATTNFGLRRSKIVDVIILLLVVQVAELTGTRTVQVRVADVENSEFPPGTEIPRSNRSTQKKSLHFAVTFYLTILRKLEDNL